MTDHAPYTELTAVPSWERVRPHENADGTKGLPLPAQDPANLRWGGKHDVPVIGARVRVTYNGLGQATVSGYFSEGGYLGLLLALDVATKAGTKCHAFGTEFEPLAPAGWEVADTSVEG